MSDESKDNSFEDRMSEEEQIKISNYLLGKTIGQGTFNKVKIAKHILTNEQVAIKIIDKQKIQNQSDRKRLNKQLKILRKVRHPNITQLYEILEDRKYFYIVNEYSMRGELFQHILKQEKLTEFEASKFLQQILDAVEYLHQIGVAHRDLKPQNLLLDYRYNIKVIDFGLSNIYSKDQKLRTACGSPCYAAPEMLKNQPYDGLKIDIWSIGIILYAMCFGYLPFDQQDSGLLYKKIMNGKYEIPDHASQDLIQLLSRILQTNPSKRATIQEIRSHNFCKFSPIGLVPGIIVGLSDIPYEKQIESEMAEMRLNIAKLKEYIKNNKHNDLSVTYYLLLQRILRLRNMTTIAYYTEKGNQINRYILIQKVKKNYENRLKIKIEQMMTKTSSDKKKKRHRTTMKKNHRQVTPLKQTAQKRLFSPQKDNKGTSKKKTPSKKLIRQKNYK